MENQVLHFVLIRCHPCKFNHEQLGVIDCKGEDCGLFEKLVEVRSELKKNPRFCDCGAKLYATYSASVFDQHKSA